MQNYNTDFGIQEDSEKTLDIQLLVFRILPFWPLILLALLLGYVGARIYLRYADKIYEVKARVIVNDDSQQKTANLIDIMQLDTRNMSTETEKEMEILGSRDLLGRLVKKLQLNIKYTSKGYIRSSDNYGHMPFNLELEQPDSVTSQIEGNVHFENGYINFNNVLYPVDTIVQSKFGKIVWHVNSGESKNLSNNEWYLTIQPISQTVTQIQQSLLIDPISKQSSILVITYKDQIKERALNLLNNLLISIWYYYYRLQEQDV